MLSQSLLYPGYSQWPIISTKAVAPKSPNYWSATVFSVPQKLSRLTPFLCNKTPMSGLRLLSIHVFLAPKILFVLPFCSEVPTISVKQRDVSKTVQEDMPTMPSMSQLPRNYIYTMQSVNGQLSLSALPPLLTIQMMSHTFFTASCHCTHISTCIGNPQ